MSNSQPRRNFYLIDDQPILTMPNLAVAIGLHEAMVIQQLHYWLVAVSYRKGEDDIHYQEGRWWVWNSYTEWQKQFPWWTTRTIRSLFGTLRDRGCQATIRKGHRRQLETPMP